MILSETLYVNRRNCLRHFFLQAFEGREGQTKHPVLLCTVGRFSYPKAIDRAVYICVNWCNRALIVCWYVVGYGGDKPLIRKAIAETGMEKHFVLAGKQMNPYPYIKACDIYVQPSRYEGKAVTVREAQILGKPVVITRFPTSSSQLEEGVDGIIIPNNVEGAAEGLAQFIADKTTTRSHQGTTTNPPLWERKRSR